MRALPVVLLLCAACSPTPVEGDDNEDEFVEDLDSLPNDGKDDGNMQVQDYLHRGCTTAPVLRLSRQIADRIACTMPDVTVRFEANAHIRFTGAAVLPYLDPAAVAELNEAAAEVGVLSLNSVYRTVAQQYLLYKWFKQGRCGITAAAKPGLSNHESGRAMDVANYGAAKRALVRHGWREDVARDPVHFDHVFSPDNRGLDTMAFQQLWNLNHPDDRIDEDGDFGAATEQRMRITPASGFPISGCM